MYKAVIDKSKITITNDTAEMLVSGSVNINFIEFEFSEDWSGLQKTIIFQTKKVSLPIILDEDTTILPIPWEAIAYAGESINIGAYGIRMDDVSTDEDETIVLPTVWGTIGKVQQGVKVPNVPGPYPTPDAYYQLLKLIEDLIENGGTGGGGAGTFNHDLLKNRDLPDQHPIDSITGLREVIVGHDTSLQTLTELTADLKSRLDALVIPDTNDWVTQESFREYVAEAAQNLKSLSDRVSVLESSGPVSPGLTEVTWDDVKNKPQLVTPEDLETYDANTESERVRGMTKDVFQSLSDEEKKGLVVVTDEDDGGGGSSGGSLDVYFAEETRVGTWIDGKPIYRRVINTKTVNATDSDSWVDSTIDDGLDDVDTMIKYSFRLLIESPYVQISNGYRDFSLGWNYRTKRWAFVQAYASTINKDIQIVAYYTKTTD